MPMPTPAAVCAALDGELDSARERVLFAVPSTEATLQCIPRWLAARPGTAVVAPAVAGQLTPAQWLARQRAAPGQDRFLIVFSDQLLSAADAPMLVEQGGRLSYLPGLEVVAQGGHGFAVAAWVGNGFEAAPRDGGPVAILGLLARHLAACAELGAPWLMREAQQQRCADAHVAEARRRLRVFHSAIMHARGDAPLGPEARAIVRRIVDLQKGMARAAGA